MRRRMRGDGARVATVLAGLLLGFGSGCSTAAGTAGMMGASGSVGQAGQGASQSGGGSSGGTGAVGGAGCDRPGLTWKTARKTWYTSHPDPNSEECVKYNGCTWAGQFAACSGTKPEAWVAARNIAAAFPDFDSLALHDLCLKSGEKTLVVTVLDTCADTDCDGCCTQNQGSAEQLIDLESYTNQRWGLEDGEIQWADLGSTQGSGCN